MTEPRSVEETVHAEMRGAYDQRVEQEIIEKMVRGSGMGRPGGIVRLQIETCHCGLPVDRSQFRDRGMCTDCDSNRCDTSDGMAAGCPSGGVQDHVTGV